jgi:hypothetical protein
MRLTDAQMVTPWAVVDTSDPYEVTFHPASFVDKVSIVVVVVEEVEEEAAAVDDTYYLA